VCLCVRLRVVHRQASYAVQSATKSFPVYVPGAFSTTLGSGLTGTAPYRYVAASAVAGLRAINYTGIVVPLIDEHHASASQLAPLISPSSFQSEAALLPISKVASASSAFMGAAALMGFLVDELQALVAGDVRRDGTPTPVVAPPSLNDQRPRPNCRRSRRGSPRRAVGKLSRLPPPSSLRCTPK
jgi:hypothetical protein